MGENKTNEDSNWMIVQSACELRMCLIWFKWIKCQNTDRGIILKLLAA